MNLIKTSVVTVAALFAFSSAHAADAFQDGKDFYAKRADVTKDANGLRNIDKAVSAFSKAEADAKTAGDKDQQYNAMIWGSKSLNFSSVLESDAKKKVPFLDSAYKKAQDAKALNATLADAQYYTALSAGRLMSIYKDQGDLVKALKFKGDYEASLKALNTTKSLAGDPGVSIDGYGFYRLAGRFQHAGVGNILVGGDRSKAIKLLQVANEMGFEKAPDTNKVALNVVYYAEVLAKDGSPDDFTPATDAEVDTAKKLLTALLAMDPTKVNPDRVYETQQDFVLAKELLDEINKF